MGGLSPERDRATEFVGEEKGKREETREGEKRAESEACVGVVVGGGEGGRIARLEHCGRLRIRASEASVCVCVCIGARARRRL